MNNFKIIGTRGKKRKKALKLLAFLGIAVSAVCFVIIFLMLSGNAGSVLAGHEASPPGTLSGDDPAVNEELREPGTKDKSTDEAATVPGEGTVDGDEREISFGPIGIGPNIRKGDYIDIRLMCNDGTDYIVVSKKELIDYNASTGMSVIRVGEGELLTLNSALADRNSMTGVTLYAVKYVDPLSQEPADVSYQPNEAVCNQIRERMYGIGR